MASVSRHSGWVATQLSGAVLQGLLGWHTQISLKILTQTETPLKTRKL